MSETDQEFIDRQIEELGDQLAKVALMMEAGKEAKKALQIIAESGDHELADIARQAFVCLEKAGI